MLPQLHTVGMPLAKCFREALSKTPAPTCDGVSNLREVTPGDRGQQMSRPWQSFIGKQTAE